MSEEKSRYRKVIDGDKIPEGEEKGFKNLTPINERDPEEALAIRRKAAETTNRKKKERKTFREDIIRLLGDTEIALALAKATNNQDIIEAAERHGANVQEVLTMSAALQASLGNIKAQEFIRDTAGEKPKDQVELQADIMTEADRKLLEKVNNRLS